MAKSISTLETVQKEKSFIGQWKEKNDSRIKDWKHSVRLFTKSPLAMIGLIIVIFFILVALFAPYIAPYPNNWRDLTAQRLAPSEAHILGTEIYGGDILSMIIWGSRVSLTIGFLVVFSILIFGTIVGAVAGYFGGKIDELIMRITDIFLAFPSLVLSMVIVAALGSGLQNVMISIAIVSWPAYARLIRGQVLSIKERNYIEAARAVGASDWRIITRHLIPNSLAPTIVQATMDVGSIIITSAALSFIGMGAGPGEAEWGRMINDGQSMLLNAPWISTFPGLAILIFCLGFNLLGDGLRDIMDPRMRR
jgi:peptide/nickel transport system permease protein